MYNQEFYFTLKINISNLYSHYRPFLKGKEKRRKRQALLKPADEAPVFFFEKAKTLPNTLYRLIIPKLIIGECRVSLIIAYVMKISYIPCENETKKMAGTLKKHHWYNMYKRSKHRTQNASKHIRINSKHGVIGVQNITADAGTSAGIGCDEG